jgi:signal transduction histidine kinase
VDANQAVTFELAPRCEILGRAGALRRAVTNVVENAVKYAGAARVRLVPLPTEFAVEIDDDGPGIPEVERERVFAPFYRIESSRNRETGDNRDGGGLRVTILLPLLPRSTTSAGRAGVAERVRPA